jgi:hypothetical protein
LSTQNRRGSGLALVLLVASVLAIMVATVGNNTMQHLQDTNTDLFTKEARYAAYAGLQAALVHLAVDRTWIPDPNPLEAPLPGNPLVSATVHVYNNYGGVLGDPSFTAPDGTEVPKGATYLLALGRAAGRTSQSQAVMLSMAWFGDSPLTMAAFAQERIVMTNSYTDAWASVNGTGTLRQKYASTVHAGKANVGTNALVQAIELNGSRVNGDVIVGAGGNPVDALRMDPTSQITGEATPEPETVRMQQFKPPYDPDLAADPGSTLSGSTMVVNPGDYTVLEAGPGMTVELAGGGTYLFKDALRLHGARLEISPASGPVWIYVGRELVIDGGSKVNSDDTGPDAITQSLSTSGVPANLRVMMCGDGTPTSKSTAVIDGSQAWMVLCGRKLEVTVSGGSELYGCVRASQITVTGSALHYDTTLASVSLSAEVAWTPDVTTDHPADDPNLVDVFPNINQPYEPPPDLGNTGETPTPTPTATPGSTPTDTPTSQQTPTPTPTHTPHYGGGGGGTGRTRTMLF